MTNILRPLSGSNTINLIGRLKSIQKGSTTGSTTSRSIFINQVNPNKCFVYLEFGGSYYIGNTLQPTIAPSVASLTPTVLVITGGYYGVTLQAVNWTIIEYE